MIIMIIIIIVFIRFIFVIMMMIITIIVEYYFLVSTFYQYYEHAPKHMYIPCDNEPSCWKIHSSMIFLRTECPWLVRGFPSQAHLKIWNSGNSISIRSLCHMYVYIYIHTYLPGYHDHYSIDLSIKYLPSIYLLFMI